MVLDAVNNEATMRVRRRWLRVDRDLWRRLPRIVVATAVMGIVIVVLQMLLVKNFNVHGSQLGRIAALAVLVITGLGIYLAALQVLGVVKLGELRAAIRNRL